MKNNFTNSLNALKKTTAQFDVKSNLLKTDLLNRLHETDLPAGKKLLEYHDHLLFMLSCPGNKALYKLAEKSLKRIAAKLKQNQATKKSLPENQGLPYCNILTRFSPDLLKWLCIQKDLKVHFDSFYKPVLNLNEVLNITLPAVLKAQTTAGISNEALLQVLKVQPHQYIDMLLDQTDQLSHMPLVKDLLTEKLDLYVKLVPANLRFCRAFNRIPVKQLYYHSELLKHFDHEKLIQEKLPAAEFTGNANRTELIKVIKYAMALTARETDTATFMQEDSIKLFTLERGIAVALYDMVPQRQLPLESYVGFTLFKNGLPVSYGGAWIFGARARIGINIFEPYRGGESGYIMCQLLRVYKQVFEINFFEAEPYQYGLDNPDGITSGAFWFYYRYGFRPLNRQLLQLSKNEYQKIKTRKKYRSSAKTLVRFTGSNIALNTGKTIPPDVAAVSANLLSMLKKGWKQNGITLQQQAVKKFCSRVNIQEEELNSIEKNILQEVALWALAMNIHQPGKLALMKQMVFIKGKNSHAYQQLLLTLLRD